MRPRTYIVVAGVLACAAFVLACAGAPVPAHAWMDSTNDHLSNPLDDRYWGTHDWVTWQAYVAAGRPEWIDVGAAIVADDDPDRSGGKADHVYQVDTNYGGAPHEAANIYARVLALHAAGDDAEASRQFGLLSHYYADSCVPYHTVPRTLQGPYAYDYEAGVKTRAHHKTDDLFLEVRDRRVPTSVRAQLIASAYVAHRRLPMIQGAWPAGGTDNADVIAATKACLSEAVNGLADLMAAVPNGDGLGPVPTSFAVFKPYDRYVKKDTNAGIYAKVVDETGAPIRGVKVTFVWVFKGGVRTHVRYTGSDGYARSWQFVGRHPYYRHIAVSATIENSGSVLGSRTTWVETTPGGTKP